MTPPPIGHNSSEVVEAKELRKYLERVEKLIEDRKSIGEDIRDLKTELKGRGFDVQAFNECLKLRRMDSEKRREREELRALYIDSAGLC